MEKEHLDVARIHPVSAENGDKLAAVLVDFSNDLNFVGQAAGA
jgi:hypothetical protein